VKNEKKLMNPYAGSVDTEASWFRDYQSRGEVWRDLSWPEWSAGLVEVKLDKKTHSWVEVK